MRCLVVVFLIMVVSVVCFASEKPKEEQEPVVDSSSAFGPLDSAVDSALEQIRHGDTEPGQVVMPEGLSLADLDEPTREKYFEALKECFQYRISGFQHRKEVFEWQLFSSKVIFVVVVVLVGAGIYFSWLQFSQSLEPGHIKAKKKAHKSVEATEEKGNVTAKEMGATKLKASVQGIEIDSPILGVVILVISLLFFYLYLVYVYPIEEIF